MQREMRANPRDVNPIPLRIQCLFSLHVLRNVM